MTRVLLILALAGLARAQTSPTCGQTPALACAPSSSTTNGLAVYTDTSGNLKDGPAPASANDIPISTGGSTWTKRTLDSADFSVGASTIQLGAQVSELGSCIGETTDFCSTVALTGTTTLLPNGTASPAGTCTQGSVYMDTDATTLRRFYGCDTANQWGQFPMIGAQSGGTLTLESTSHATKGYIDLLDPTRLTEATVPAATPSGTVLVGAESGTPGRFYFKNENGNVFREPMVILVGTGTGLSTTTGTVQYFSASGRMAVGTATSSLSPRPGAVNAMTIYGISCTIGNAATLPTGSSSRVFKLQDGSCTASAASSVLNNCRIDSSTTSQTCTQWSATGDPLGGECFGIEVTNTVSGGALTAQSATCVLYGSSTTF